MLEVIMTDETLPFINCKDFYYFQRSAKENEVAVHFQSYKIRFNQRALMAGNF